MFVRPVSDGGDVVGFSCAYSERQLGVVATPAAEGPAETPEEDGICFSDRVYVDGAGEMKHVRVGDGVIGRDGADEIVGFSRRADIAARFVRLHLANGAKLELSRGHYVALADGRLLPARDVRVGMRLLSRREGGNVTFVDAVVRVGVHAPVTRSGYISVGGVLVSCYTELLPERVAHALLLAMRVWKGGMWRVVADCVRVGLWKGVWKGGVLRWFYVSAGFASFS